MRDLKYLIAYIAPLAGFFAIYQCGIWSFAGLYIAFVAIPLLELILPASIWNFPPEVEESRLKNKYFDFLLYLHVPILYTMIGLFIWRVASTPLEMYEIIGLTISVGVMIGSFGINVGHELGHRNTWHETLMSKMLYLPALYLHFSIEHNLGHHKHVATPLDPATSRKGELIYTFWFRSSIGGYLSAWNIENNRLRKKGLSIFSIHNAMIWNNLIQIAYLGAIAYFFSWTMMILIIIMGVFGFLLLESVNYIEHYGLQRKKLASGRYEPVQPHHSWNSNHELGRIFLYELTRHSDHHFKANRKYQILRHFEHAPQLPLGYPASIILALFPPVWFMYMNKKVEQQRLRLEQA